MRVRGYARLAVAACLVLPITACNGDDKPSTLPTAASSSPETTQRSSPGTSVTGAAAADAVSLLWRAYDGFAQAEQEAEAVRQLFTTECAQCVLTFNAIRQIRNAGQHVEGGEHTVIVIGTTVKAAHQFQVQASIAAKPGRVVDAGGRVIRSGTGSAPFTWIFLVNFNADRGQVSSATNLGA